MRPQYRPYGRPGRRTQNSRRRTGLRPLIPVVLIVCEGEKTEPKYFQLFSPRLTVRRLDIRGEGKSTLSLVEQTESIDAAEGPFDEIWCVFDRDSFEPDDYDNAIQKLRSKARYFAAYSNEAFELWFLHHFEFLNAAVTRHQYIEKLTKHLGCRYVKNDADVYRQIQQAGNESRAIQWADKLLEQCSPETPLSRCCPSTTVHELVRKLRAWESESKI